MSVQLLPFQKLADIPDVAQRHRCAIHGLAITSIVLICTLLFLFVSALIASGGLYASFYLLLFLGIASMTILFFMVTISSAIALHNTDAWVPADVCCNLMRSNPARCTRSCSGSKHCCARLSSTHIGASVLASLICVLFVAALFSGCGEAAANSARWSARYQHSARYERDYRHYDDDIASDNERYDNERVAPTTTSTGTYPSDYYRYYYAGTSCGVAAAFEIPAIILLISLVATTARSAYLLRQIEQSMPEIAALPPGKMVTQSDQLVPFVPHPIVRAHPIDTGNDEKSSITTV